MPNLFATTGRRGVEPYSIDLPITGFPAAAHQPVRRRGALTDEFLTTIARQYLIRGRGYATTIAGEYSVSRRLSSPPGRGAVGGRLTAKHDG